MSKEKNKEVKRLLEEKELGIPKVKLSKEDIKKIMKAVDKGIS
jgi:hypothetical protein